MSEQTNGSSALLSLEGVNTYYGQMHILQDTSLNVGEGELVCLLGGNASGKVDHAEDGSRDSFSHAQARCLRRRGRHRSVDELPHREGHGDRPGESTAVRPDVRAREPADGRIPPRRRASPRTTSACTRCSRCSTSAAPSSPGRSPAGSSRWWRWGGRSWRGRSFSDGRAVDGARADPRRAELRDHQAGARRRRRDAHRRAERQRVALDRRSWLRPVDRADRSRGEGSELLQHDELRKAYLGR